LESVVLKVDGMSCAHCITAINNAVGGLPGVGEVNVSLEAGSVGVKFDSGKVSLARIEGAIEDQGYDIVRQG
jgi:copper chaperone